MSMPGVNSGTSGGEAEEDWSWQTPSDNFRKRRHRRSGCRRLHQHDQIGWDGVAPVYIVERALLELCDDLTS